jgi:hypothetical protein
MKAAICSLLSYDTENLSENGNSRILINVDLNLQDYSEYRTLSFTYAIR